LPEEGMRPMGAASGGDIYGQMKIRWGACF